MTESTKAIGDRLGNDGYAFANVNAVPEVDKEKRTVAFTFFVDPGRRVYVHRINVSGNARTRDEVLRREMRQLESAWYDASKIERSKQRLQRLNYFEDVNIETPAVPGTTDQVDINIDVKEKSTGSIMFGAGLSSAEGVVLGVTVNQDNFLGTGNRVNAQVNTGKVNTTYSLSYTDPYFTPDGVSRTFDIYRKDVDATYNSVGNYKTSSYGIGMNFGIPLNERDTVSFGSTLDYTSITLLTGANSRYVQYCGGNTAVVLAETGTASCDNMSLRLNLGWKHDTRDNIMFPNSGVLQRIDTEIGLPGLDQQYYKVNYQQSWYKDITRNITFMLNGEAGIAGSYGNSIFPFFKNFYAGGVSSVRGFDQSSLGPRANETTTTNAGTASAVTTTTDYAVGGTRRVVGNAELFMPVPGLRDSKQFRLSAFLDGGSVWGGSSGPLASPTCTGAGDCFRYSTGVGISWLSPFGPLKLVLAKPLNEKAGDKTQMLQFQFGSQF